jgi:dTDP-glucose 4,6-dehydratase
MWILVTGGCGFIGSNFIRHVLQARKNIEVVNLDLLTYAGNLRSLVDVEETFPDRYRFVRGDIREKEFLRRVFETFEIESVVHFAAESHVDRSILGPEVFVQTNVYGTFNLLEICRKSWPTADVMRPKRFLHISTDEVYGSLGTSGCFTEESPYLPSSPYAASKAASDHMVHAYFRTFGLPTLTTHSSNNYGPFQFPEKLIPLMISNAREGLPLPVYGDGRNVRDWIYVEDHCRALLQVLEKGTPGHKYNIGANCEKQNIDVVNLICDYLDEHLGLIKGQQRKSLIRFVHDRLGHDQRYALDTSKIRDTLGWKPEVPFHQGLRRTVAWYLDNPVWAKEILDGSYMEYYEKQYGARLNER